MSFHKWSIYIVQSTLRETYVQTKFQMLISRNNEVYLSTLTIALVIFIGWFARLLHLQKWMNYILISNQHALSWKVSTSFFFEEITISIAYLDDIGVEKFTIGKSPVPHYSRTTNNYSEHINSIFRKARTLPILHAFNVMYLHIITQHYERVSKMYPAPQQFVDHWNEKITARSVISRSHTLRQNGI